MLNTIDKLLMKKIIFLLLCLFVGIGTVFAQTRRVTGTVVSAEDGELIPGASVVVKGDASIGTITMADGKFSFEVPQSAQTLVVKYLGMIDQEVAVSGSEIRVVMQESTSMLDEVVVVAYGTATRAQFVGSAKTVSGEKIAATSTSNVTNALQGKAAGVQVINNSGQPGTGASIRIRGVGSINGGTTPLYVVDGAPYETDVMNMINPHDIETMTVLKDAAATAIYGARGANGVVLITTKKGTSFGKAVVNVETKWGNASRGVPNYNVMTDPAMYYETAYLALFNSQKYAGRSDGDSHTYANNNFLSQSGVGYQIYTVPDGERLVGMNFKLNPNARLGYSDGDFYYIPDNWEKETLKANNLRQEYNFSVQGGTSETQYFVSGGYLDNPGLVGGSGFERYTFRAKIDNQAKSWLKVGANATYGYSNYQNPGYQTSWGSTGNVFYTANTMAPIYPFYVRNADSSLKVDGRGYQIYDQGTSTNFVRPGSAPRGNHSVNLLLDENYEKMDHFNGNAYVTLTPIEGLSFTTRFSTEAANSRSSNLSNPFYGSPSSEGWLSVGHTRLITLNQNYLINYKKTFAEIHKIEVLAGYENYSLLLQTLSGSNDHLFSPFIGELNNAFGTQPTSNNARSSSDHFGTAGFLGRIQYDLHDRYFINATARHEGSSRFAPDKRWGTFGSVGGAWLITNESFMNNTKTWLDELKFKISFGTQGNDQLRNFYAFRDLYNISYNSDTGEYSKTLSGKGNPDLTWESQQLFNAGFEFSFYNKRLTGSLEYFSRLNSAMLFNLPMPPSAGFNSLPLNIGSVSNKGVELELDGLIIDKNNLKWSVYANATTINSKILKLPEYAKETGGIKQNSSILKEGGSLNQAYTVEFAGIDENTGEALYYKDPDEGDRSTTANYADAKQTDLGNVSVKVYGGFGTTIEAYGFDLSAFFSFQLGGKAYDGTYQELMHTGKQIGRNWHMDILKAWTPENKSTEVSRINWADDHDQKTSSRWLVSSDFLSLNTLTIGYTLPAKLTYKIQVNRVRLYFAGDNLFMLSARKGFDPRQSQNANASGLGWSTTSGNYVYSQLRVISGGLSISF